MIKNIEGGKGRLEGLTITHCGSSGILASAPLGISNCKISHVKIGVAVSETTHTNVILNVFQKNYQSWRVFVLKGFFEYFMQV